jgi:Protein of unknown function (DUF732)
MSILFRGVLRPGMPPKVSREFARCGSRVGLVSMAVLVAVTVGAEPGANAAPAPGCPQGRAPGPGPGCGRRAFLADINAAGLGNSNGDQEALDQGLDLCGVMDNGVTRQNMVNQFAADNPTLGPDQAAQVVRIAIRDLCPWHR